MAQTPSSHTTQRSQALTEFFAATHGAIEAVAEPGSAPSAAARRIFAALDASTGPLQPRPNNPLPACQYLDAALEMARGGAAPIARLAETFATLEPELTWETRAGAEEHGARFVEGHANIVIVGPAALEQRSDVLIGASLLAPEIRYPDHDHPPEEIYVVLTDGKWFGDHTGWHTPGVGGIVYNPSGVTHAMHSGPSPLLAIWCLWVGH